MTVAVFGASGFVGATLVERLLTEGRTEVRPFIHSSGNAWRLARHGLQLRSVDLLSSQEVGAALEGCSYVVNCSRGPAAVMLKGLRRLLEASRTHKVRRFIHLSSTAVYGDLPPPASVREDARPNVVRGTYGWIKLRQDELVRTACQRGLPCVVLCPPNISGAYSPFLVEVLQSIRRGDFAFVDEGRTPCNLVDIENLVHAIKLALSSVEADGERIFVTDDEETMWAGVADALMTLAGRNGPLPSLTREEAVRRISIKAGSHPSVASALKRLLSSETRSALRKDSLLASLEQSAKGAFNALPQQLQATLSGAFKRKDGGRQMPREPVVGERMLRQQMRAVRHGCDRAKRVLGYRPVVSFADSMEAFASWHRTYHGWHHEPLFDLLEQAVQRH